MNRLFLIIFIGVISASAAFAEPKFSKTEVQNLLVGKTYPLGGGKGAMYVGANGTMDVTWEGKTETTKWKVKNNGRICFNLKMFGGNDCIAFEKIDAETFYHVYDGEKRKMKYSDLKAGKTF